MRDWKKELDVQLSLLVEEGTLTVDYKNAVLVQGFLEKFIETLLQEQEEKHNKEREIEAEDFNTMYEMMKKKVQEEREKVVEEIIDDIWKKADYFHEFGEVADFGDGALVVYKREDNPADNLDKYIDRLQDKYLSKKGEKKWGNL